MPINFSRKNGMNIAKNSSRLTHLHGLTFYIYAKTAGS